MTRADIERRVREIRWPEPSAELRARVLSAAPAAELQVTWSDRIWFSRAWRIAATAGVIAVIVFEGVAAMPGMGRAESAAPVHADEQGIEQAGRDAGLPPDVAQSLARRASLGVRPAGADERVVAQALDIGGH